MVNKTITPFLATVLVSGSSGVVRYRGGAGAINNMGLFGSLETGVIVGDQPLNRVVFFNGALYATLDTHIYVCTNYDGLPASQGGLIFNAVYTLPSINTSTAFKSGLSVIPSPDGSTIYLCMMYFDTSSTLRTARSTDGVNWSSDGPFSVGGGTPASFHNDTVFQNQLWALTSVSVAANGRLIAYNPAGQSINYYALPTGFSSVNSCMGVFNNSLLFWMAKETNNVTDVQALYILKGNFADITTVLTKGVSPDFKPAMFVDGNYLYAFTFIGTSFPTGTWKCYQIDSNYTVTDISAAVIPSGMAGTATSRVLAWVNTDWAPGSNPPKYLMFAANGTNGTNITCYQWNNPGANLFQIGNPGGNVSNGFSLSKMPTASGFYVIGPSRVVIGSVAGDTSGTGLRIAFWVKGPITGGLAPNIRLWYAGDSEEYLTNIGILSNPSTGSLNAAGTAILNVTVNNDQYNPYYVTWTPSSGILGTNGEGTRCKYAMEAFT